MWNGCVCVTGFIHTVDILEPKQGRGVLTTPFWYIIGLRDIRYVADHEHTQRTPDWVPARCGQYTLASFWFWDASVNKENMYVCGIVQLKQGLKADFGPLCGSV